MLGFSFFPSERSLESTSCTLLIMHNLLAFLLLPNWLGGERAPQPLCVLSNGAFTCHCTKPVKYLQHRQQYLVLNTQLWVWIFSEINLWQVFPSKMLEDFTNSFKRPSGSKGAVIGHLVITYYYLYSTVDVHTDVIWIHIQRGPNKDFRQNATAEQVSLH